MPTQLTKAQLRALPKKQRREVARQVAREQRIAEQRRRRRRRNVVQVVAVVVAVGVLTGAVLGVRTWVAERNRGPLNMASDGILLSGYQGNVYGVPTGSVAQGGIPTANTPNRNLGVLDAVLYVDYSSPTASTLWSTAGPELVAGLKAETTSLEIHPIAPDGSASAVRSAAALACVAELDPNQALPAHQALVSGGADWTPASVMKALTDAGVKAPGLDGCITSGRFTGWVRESTARAARSVPFDVGSVTSTTLLLAGTAYTGAPDDAKAFASAYADAQAVVAKASASSSPSPTAGATSSPTSGATQAPSPSTSPTSGG
ncbi:hypothetical protein Q6346_11485 [Isoptericola sp. b490]|uniref:DsbA family protein n=1 Tax=Actinotalea lenta TaxID=3064654 RepID=UPI002713FCE6|nr:hypothetical protein [Isoptericola sp. b490]MDO8121932.1 hypothetical protein [Isoptericola sp. b490]